MSDVGLNFSALDFFLYGSIVALPVTTILLALLIWRRIAAGAGRPVLNAGIAVLGVLWVVPAGLVAVLWVDGLVEEMRAAQRHFTLTAERRIDGVVLPAESEVILDGYDRLESVTLPDGAEITLDGTAWRGFIKFASSQDKDAAATARVGVGQPATDASFDGVSCRAGQPVSFWGAGGLRSCTLAGNIPAEAEIADAERGRARRASFAPAISSSRFSPDQDCRSRHAPWRLRRTCRTHPARQAPRLRSSAPI
jgi:hypothetical protein